MRGAWNFEPPKSDPKRVERARQIGDFLQQQKDEEIGSVNHPRGGQETPMETPLSGGGYGSGGTSQAGRTDPSSRGKPPRPGNPELPPPSGSRVKDTVEKGISRATGAMDRARYDLEYKTTPIEGSREPRTAGQHFLHGLMGASSPYKNDILINMDSRSSVVGHQDLGNGHYRTFHRTGDVSEHTVGPPVNDPARDESAAHLTKLTHSMESARAALAKSKAGPKHKAKLAQNLADAEQAHREHYVAHSDAYGSMDALDVHEAAHKDYLAQANAPKPRKPRTPKPKPPAPAAPAAPAAPTLWTPPSRPSRPGRSGTAPSIFNGP
jgi:hypothetical protein